MSSSSNGSTTAALAACGAVGLVVGAALGGAAAVQMLRKGRQAGSHRTVEEAKVRVGADEEELMAEQCKRNIQFLGEAEFAQLRSKYVVIVGLGGTGSHAANMLARSGVQHLRFVDFDQVTLSSLNRHAVATRADVGKSKVAVMRSHLLLSLPGLDCEAVQRIFRIEDAEELLLGGHEGGPARKPDFVIDCIDNVTTKADLLYFCVSHDIKVLSCAGAGCRIDPTKLRISDISETSKDPLIRATRHALNRKYKMHRGVPCLYSLEDPVRGLMDLMEGEQEEDPAAFQALPDIGLRVRIVPVLGPLPAMFGNALAMAVIAALCGFDLSEKDVDKLPKRTYDKMLRSLIAFEAKNHGDEPAPSADERLTWGDVEYVVQDLYRGKSAFSNIGYNRKRLEVVRWDKNKRPSVDNLVCLTKDEVDRHYSKVAFEAWPAEFVEKINKKIAEQEIPYA